MTKVFLIHIEKIGNEYGSLLIIFVTQGFESFFRDLNLTNKNKKPDRKAKYYRNGRKKIEGNSVLE